MVINNAADFTIDGKTLVNPAGQTATWTGINTAITLKDGAGIVNDGTFNVQALGDLNSTGNQGAAVAFTNNGAFVYDDTGQTFSIQNVAFNVASPGTVDGAGRHAPDRRGRGGGTSTGGVFTADAGGTLDFAGGTYTLDASSSIAGAGTVSFTGGTETMAGTYDVTGTTVFQAGTVNFNGPVSSIGSTLTALGGTANFGANPLTPTTLTVTDGTLKGRGT